MYIFIIIYHVLFCYQVRHRSFGQDLHGLHEATSRIRIAYGWRGEWFATSTATRMLVRTKMKLCENHIVQCKRSCVQNDVLLKIRHLAWIPNFIFKMSNSVENFDISVWNFLYLLKNSESNSSSMTEIFIFQVAPRRRNLSRWQWKTLALRVGNIPGIAEREYHHDLMNGMNLYFYNSIYIYISFHMWKFCE